eukprot:235178-Chlamydomonas_euryale.AAC.11
MPTKAKAALDNVGGKRFVIDTSLGVDANARVPLEGCNNAGAQRNGPEDAKHGQMPEPSVFWKDNSLLRWQKLAGQSVGMITDSHMWP